jgi:predicted small lipoprotein YifL
MTRSILLAALLALAVTACGEKAAEAPVEAPAVEAEVAPVEAVEAAPAEAEAEAEAAPAEAEAAQ